MATCYKGWLPTATGRLSFSLIGDNCNSRETTKTNQSDSKDRYLIINQERILIDATLPAKKWLPRILINLVGSFNFLCIAKSSDDINKVDDRLKGQLYILGRGSELYKAELETGYARFMLMRNGGRTKSLSLAEKFESCFQTTMKAVGRFSLFYVDFSLDRNGEVEIIIPDDMGLAENAPRFPEDQKRRERLIHNLCSQCFFFLRDLVHNHQHHSPTTDSLLDVYKTTDDITWRGETLRVLYRKIVDFKRKRKDEIYCSSLGLLAYVKSFKSICKKTLPRGTKLNPDIDDSILEASIKAGQVATQNSVHERIKASETTRNLIISFLGLFLSFLGLAKLTGQEITSKNDHILRLAELTYNYPAHACVIAYLVIYIAGVMKGTIKPRSYVAYESAIGIYKMIQAVDKRYNFLVWVLLGSGGLWIISSFLLPAIYP